MDRLAIVSGVGIDPVENGDEVALSIQIIKPGQVSPTGAGGGQGAGGGGSKAYLMVKSQGSTIFQAVRRAHIQSGRRLYWPHNEVIIFGESIANKGIRPYFDFFVRDTEPRPSQWVIVARGQAGELLQVPPLMEDISGLEFTFVIEDFNLTSFIFPVTVQEMLNRLLSRTTAPIAPVFKKEGSAKVVVDGTAVFKEDRMIGFLNINETRGLLWVIDKVRSGIVEANLDEERRFSLEIVSSRGELRPEVQNGRIRAKIRIKTEVNIGEEMGMDTLASPERLHRLEQAGAQTIRQEIMAAWNRAQEMSADIYGLGEAIGRRYRREWKGMEPRWEELFSQVEPEIEVKVVIRRLGKIKSPLVPETQGG